MTDAFTTSPATDASINLENEVQKLHQNIDIYKMAIEQLMSQRAQQRQQIEQLNQRSAQHDTEKSSWLQMEAQYNEVVTTLAEQLRKMDNDNSDMSNENKKLSSQLDQQQLKGVKSLKKKARQLKRLKRHVRETNTLLDDVICNGDCILSELENE